jgi:nitrogen fixation NifU-like protein
MLIEQMEGKTIDHVKQFSADDMLKLFGARLTPNRQKCCLLSWKVLQAAVFAPIDEDADAPSHSAFSGPDLGEES